MVLKRQHRELCNCGKGPDLDCVDSHTNLYLCWNRTHTHTSICVSGNYHNPCKYQYLLPVWHFASSFDMRYIGTPCTMCITHIFATSYEPKISKKKKQLQNQGVFSWFPKPNRFCVKFFIHLFHSDPQSSTCCNHSLVILPKVRCSHLLSHPTVAMWLHHILSAGSIRQDHIWQSNHTLVCGALFT